MAHPLLQFLSLWRSGRYIEAVKNLTHSCADPDESVLEYWKKEYFAPTVQLGSTGSSSGLKLYNFGPIEGILAVENLLKKLPLIMLQMHSGASGFYPIRNKKYSYLFVFDHNNPDFSKLWQKKGFGLCAAPNIWLFLSKQKNFLSEVSNRISTTGWEPFFDKSLFPVIVNDNMLNLKTGDSFYTCDHGSVHCLPFKLKIGDKVVNLLNSDKTLHDDDDIITWEYRKCQCGVRLPICVEKHCHTKNSFRPDLGLATLLQGQYKNWQAVKTLDSVNLFLSGNYPKEDLGVIRERLGECVVWENKRYRTGINKWASFWSSDSIQDNFIEDLN